MSLPEQPMCDLVSEDEYAPPPPLDVQLDTIMDCFDFGRMLDVMRFMNWKWSGVDEETGEPFYTPSESDLRILARRMLREVASWEQGGRTLTGGFLAENKDGYLALYFVAVFWEELS